MLSRYLPPVPYDACDTRTTRVTSLSLVRYRRNDYSVPTAYGHREVLVKGAVDEVVIVCGSAEIARHRRSYDRDVLIFEPRHYFCLVGAQDGRARSSGTAGRVAAAGRVSPASAPVGGAAGQTGHARVPTGVAAARRLSARLRPRRRPGRRASGGDRVRRRQTPRAVSPSTTGRPASIWRSIRICRLRTWRRPQRRTHLALLGAE